MAITYPLSTPTNKTIASITLVARNVIGVSTSPFNFKQQVHQYSGQRWEADITLPTMGGVSYVAVWAKGDVSFR